MFSSITGGSPDEAAVGVTSRRSLTLSFSPTNSRPILWRTIAALGISP